MQCSNCNLLIVFFKMFIAVCLLLTISQCQVQSTNSAGSSSLSTDNIQYIEAALANISAQVAAHNSDKSLSHSLTSVTSLLQLSLLKGLLADDSTTSTSTNSSMRGEEAYLLLKTIITNQKSVLQDITKLQEQVTAMFSSFKSDIKKILKNTQINASSSIEDSTSSLPHSCTEIKSSSADSSSGYYSIVDSNGYTRHVYCHMEELCGSSDGWTKIAYLNMSDPKEKCPEGFKLYESNGVKACGRQSSGCVSTTFPADGISYSEVCGKVIGYQYYTTDGAGSSASINNINNAYIDGISLTHGNPRSHIWTFISGLSESGSRSYCPCGTVDSRSAPSFVGEHYYCEAAAVDPHYQSKLYTDDPLWDGKGCGSIEGPCCTPPGVPWFHRSFQYTTDDYIELRVCANQQIADEDIPVTFFEIYVK